VRPERFELPTFWFVARRSIQLSYERTVAGKILSCRNPECVSLCRSCGYSHLLVSAAGGLYPAELRAHCCKKNSITSKSRVRFPLPQLWVLPPSGFRRWRTLSS
jgi:hypothetical protein